MVCLSACLFFFFFPVTDIFGFGVYYGDEATLHRYDFSSHGIFSNVQQTLACRDVSNTECVYNHAEEVSSVSM